MNRSSVRTVLVGLAVVVLGWHAPAGAASGPRCRRLCKEAIQDCWALTSEEPGARLSHCRKAVRSACREDEGTHCLAARGRAQQCAAECVDLVADCETSGTCDASAVETACRVSDAGLAACQAATTRADECRASCAPIADPCSVIVSMGGAGTCTDLVDQKCRENGLEYCAASETVNGCNRVAAEDLRGRTSVGLDPMTGGCILVSPGTVVHLESGFTLGSGAGGACGGARGPWGWLQNIGCAVRKLFRVVGGDAGDRDPESPFNTTFETSEGVRFDALGMFGYWTLGGYWGAVIVDDEASE